MNDYSLYVHIAPNNKLYFGITHLKPNYRYGKNGKGYSNCTLFWRAIQKHGWENFQHIVLLENLSKEMACLCEQYLIAKYQSTNPKYGYNGSKGGDSGSFGYVFTSEQRQKIREARLGTHLSEETKQKIGQANSKALKGKKRPQEVKDKISKDNARYWAGKKLPDKVLQAAIQANRGNNYHTGCKHSEETKQKMRLAKLGKKRGPWTDEERKSHMDAIKRRRERLQNSTI